MTATLTPAEHAAYLAIFERIKAALVAARATRDRRRGLVAGPNGRREPEWVLFERAAVHTAVAAERARLGLGPVDPAALDLAEWMATGHSDYTKKFALYAADVVIKDGAPR